MSNQGSQTTETSSRAASGSSTATVFGQNRCLTWRLLSDSRAEMRHTSNWLNSIKFDLISALEKLSALSPDDDYYLDPHVKERATFLLAYLLDNYEIDPPKLLPEDEETVSFTWQNGKIKQYLSIDTEHYDVLHLNTQSNVRCENLFGNEISTVDELMKALLFQPKSSAAYD